MSLLNPRKTDVKIIKHHRNSAVFKQGRYLVVEMKISTRSKRGREIARETAMAVLDEIGFIDSVEDMEIEIDESPGAARGLIANAPKPPDSFTQEEAEAAVGAVTGDLSTASKEQG